MVFWGDTSRTPLRSGGNQPLLAAACVAAVWRLVSEALRAVAAAGPLSRLGTPVPALAAVGVDGMASPARARGPFGAEALLGRGVSAAVSAGARPDRDVDDIGLLEGAMRRAAADRMAEAGPGARSAARARARAQEAARRGERRLAAGVLADVGGRPVAMVPRSPVPDAPRAARQRRDGGWTDWRWLEAEPGAGAGGDTARRWWPAIAVAAGLVLTMPALVRPLHDASPWLAAAAASLVLAGWLAARRPTGA